jgi:hypothetical protein
MGVPVRTGRDIFKQQIKAQAKAKVTPKPKVGTGFKVRFRPKVRVMGRKF